MSKNSEKKALILRRGIFVSVVDFVNQLTDRTANAANMVGLDGRPAQVPEEEKARHDGFIYFWEKETQCASGD